MSGIVDSLLTNVDSILGLRDSIGAALKRVDIVTRTWSGTEIGDGTATDVYVQMLPSPRIVVYNNDVRLVEGGAVRQGDILMKMISKNLYQTQAVVELRDNSSPNVEKFYALGGVLYRVVTVTEKHVTWNVLIRRVAQQATPT